MDIVYYVATSLDGFIAKAEGGVDWLEPFNTPDNDYGFSDFNNSIDALVMGRKTYEKSLTFGEWPEKEKPADPMLAHGRSKIAGDAVNRDWLFKNRHSHLHNVASRSSTGGRFAHDG